VSYIIEKSPEFLATDGVSVQPTSLSVCRWSVLCSVGQNSGHPMEVEDMGPLSSLLLGQIRGLSLRQAQTTGGTDTYGFLEPSSLTPGTFIFYQTHFPSPSMCFRSPPSWAYNLVLGAALVGEVTKTKTQTIKLFYMWYIVKEQRA
jgi:hypothetical protein